MYDTMTTQTMNIHAVIRTAADSFESTFKRGDAAGMADLYSANGMLLPTGSDFVKGKQAIEAFWQGAMDMGIKNAKLDIVEVEQHGDTAIDMGQYTLSNADGQVMDTGKYVVIWKHEDGTWKLHRDIWNSSLAQQ
jgi:uncharacterized protein (TIGR02246 family)